MNIEFSTEAIIEGLKHNKCIQHSNFELGYVPGLPILTIINSNLCMKVPYLKYKITGELDKTFIYPIRYVVTVSLPEGNIVALEDLAYSKSFVNVQFNTPVGLFRHEAIKNLDKKAYKNLRSALFAEYDKIVKHLVYGDAYMYSDEKHFKALLSVIIEPSIIPFYFAVDKEFVNKYLYLIKQNQYENIK